LAWAPVPDTTRLLTTAPTIGAIIDRTGVTTGAIILATTAMDIRTGHGTTTVRDSR